MSILSVCSRYASCKFRNLNPLFFLLALTVASSTVSAQPFAYIVSEQMNTVMVFNTQTNSLTAAIPVGISPIQVAIAPDAGRAYVTQGNGTVAVIGAASASVVATIPVGVSPTGVAVSPNGVYIYVTNENSNTVSVISAASLSVIATIPVGTRPHGVAFTPDSARAYVTNVFSAQVSVIDTAAKTVTANIPVPSGPAGIALSPNGALAYVTSEYGNTVSVIQTSTNSVVATIPVGSFPNSVAVAPNGAKAYVSNANSNSVSVIDTAANSVIATVPVGNLPSFVAVTPDGGHAYVPDTNDFNASVIDTNNYSVVTLVHIGIYMSGVAITPAPQTGVGLTLGPASVSLQGGQSQPFTATVTGTSNTAVSWSMSPSIGSMSGSGLTAFYNSPAMVGGSQTVTVTVTSLADTSKTASATITLVPVSVSVTPPSVTLTNGQSQQCAAAVSGTANTAVSWSINPLVGSISASGLYTAPSVVSSNQTVAVTAISQADPSKSGTANMILVAGGSASVTIDRVTGDLNGDGKPDLIWQNDSTRQVAVWYMGGPQGNTFQSFGWMDPNGVPGWTVVAVTDLDGNGKPDMVWQNDSTRQVAVWYMGGPQGNTFQSFGWINSNGLPGWSVRAFADLNGDGKPDIIWQNDSTRQLAIWYLGGLQGNLFQSFSWIDSNGVPGWTVRGAADLNADGKPDLILENDLTRQLAVWYMGGPQGNTFQSFSWIDSAGQPGWHVAGLTDLDGNGKPDVIRENDLTRQVSVLYMGGPQGNVVQSTGWISQTGVSGWQLIVPH